MDNSKQSNKKKDIVPPQLRKAAQEKWQGLCDFRQGYTVEKLIKDLNTYFEGEVDFNTDKINEILAPEGKLNELVLRAAQNKSHPVSELVMDIFKDFSKD
jgi:hypothetical protein